MAWICDVPSTNTWPLQGKIYEKYFLSGYIYRNKNLLSKFHVSSFGSFSSGLLVDVPPSPISPLHVVILKNPFLVVTYNVIVTYIPNFTFLASVIVALLWYVSQSVSQSVSLFLLEYYRQVFHCINGLKRRGGSLKFPCFANL